MIPDPDAGDALFLDFDGTLVELAPRPEEVVVPARLIDLLETLSKSLSGAVAIVSGRPVAQLDSLLRPLRLATVGEHGAEIRHAEGEPVAHVARMPAGLADRVCALAAGLPGTQPEIKSVSAALHFRNAPAHAIAAVEGMQALVAEIESYELLQGKMVAELKPAAVSKGLAVAQLMQESIFAGRRAVYFGDDVTDESAFRAVNELGGVSVRVGSAKQSHARYELAAVQDVHDWLKRLV